MLHTIHLTVGPDGRVEIPDTRPGETVSIYLAKAAEDNAGPITEQERAEIKARVMRLAREIRAELPEPWLSQDHGDLLYGDDGLPR